MLHIRIFIIALVVGTALNSQALGQAVTPLPTSVPAPAVQNQRKPCDILASDRASRAPTPCVAAFSTVRSLSSSYNGPLYGVARRSDSTTRNIGQTPDGYADAASQDAFCAGTSCTIMVLYDQTGNGNDLKVAPPGHAARGSGPDGYDVPAVADALPVQAGGHKVYGISIMPGMGYRNDATKGIAVNGESEGVYMVTSALPLLTVDQTPNHHICCFDFGNAETNNDDDGPARMDAINIQCSGGSSPCVPSANLDMENGIYGSLAVPLRTRLVTDMGANDGQDNYSIWQGNAQSGPLTTTGATPLPSQHGGYAPMKQQGAIILGIGGDNSDWAAGYFFEGVMTLGAPSDAAMNAIQQNIVAVGYAMP